MGASRSFIEDTMAVSTSPNDIGLRLMQAGKKAFEYKEERGYVCDDEDSWYNIKFRINLLS